MYLRVKGYDVSFYVIKHVAIISVILYLLKSCESLDESPLTLYKENIKKAFENARTVTNSVRKSNLFDLKQKLRLHNDDHSVVSSVAQRGEMLYLGPNCLHGGFLSAYYLDYANYDFSQPYQFEAFGSDYDKFGAVNHFEFDRDAARAHTCSSSYTIRHSILGMDLFVIQVAMRCSSMLRSLMNLIVAELRVGLDEVDNWINVSSADELVQRDDLLLKAIDSDPFYRCHRIDTGEFIQHIDFDAYGDNALTGDVQQIRELLVQKIEKDNCVDSIELSYLDTISIYVSAGILSLLTLVIVYINTCRCSRATDFPAFGLIQQVSTVVQYILLVVSIADQGQLVFRGLYRIEGLIDTIDIVIFSISVAVETIFNLFYIRKLFFGKIIIPRGYRGKLTTMKSNATFADK